MKDYTSESPVFSEKIRILDISDPGHADHVNEATEQLLQNTLVLKNMFGGFSLYPQKLTPAQYDALPEETKATQGLIFIVMKE